MTDEARVRKLERQVVRLFERRASDQRALKLQASEYERRLEDLNGAHEKAVQVQHTYVTQEKFEDFVARYDADREAIAKALTLAEGSEHGQGRLIGFIVGGLGAMVGLGSLILVIGDVLTP
jgi:hypothetical protein